MPPTYGPQALARDLRAARSLEQVQKVLTPHNDMLEHAYWPDVENSDIIETLLDVSVTGSIVSPHARTYLRHEPDFTAKSKTAIDIYDRARDHLGDVIHPIHRSPRLRAIMRTKAPKFLHQAYLVILHIEGTGDKPGCYIHAIKLLSLLSILIKEDGEGRNGSEL